MASVTSDSDTGSLNLAPGVVSPLATPPPTMPSGSPSVSPQDALKHVLKHVLGLPDQSGIRLSLNAAGFTKIGQVISMSTSTISLLAYKTKVGGVNINVQLLLSEEETLIALQGFASFRENQLGRPFTPDDWVTVTEGEFDTYQGSFHGKLTPPPTTPMPGVGTPLSTPGYATTTSSQAPLSAVDAFRPGICKFGSRPYFREFSRI